MWSWWIWSGPALIRLVVAPKICEQGFAFFSTESEIAGVDEIGVVKAIKPGTTEILIEDNVNGLTTQKKVKVIVRGKKKYSNEWVKGRWYNKDGTRTYQRIVSIPIFCGTIPRLS